LTTGAFVNKSDKVLSVRWTSATSIQSNRLWVWCSVPLYHLYHRCCDIFVLPPYI